MERFKALLQIVNRPWFWFAVALLCGVAAVLLSWTVRVPAQVVSVLPCSYSLGRYQAVSGSSALVQTADGRHYYTPCQQGNPLPLGMRPRWT